MKQQTDMNFDQLETELNNPFSEYKKCLVVNEIGVICLNGNKKAEAILRKLIDSGESQFNYAAFCFLSSLVFPDLESVAKIRQFRENPNNEEAIQRAEESIAWLRRAN